MDRKFIIGGIGALVLLVVVGGAFALTSGLVGASEPDITEQEAATIAENHVDGTAQSVELEHEMGGPVYEVTVETADGDLQEVEVDGNSGEILEVEGTDDEDGENDDSDADETN